jgi:hypothetical protein
MKYFLIISALVAIVISCKQEKKNYIPARSGSDLPAFNPAGGDTTAPATLQPDMGAPPTQQQSQQLSTSDAAKKYDENSSHFVCPNRCKGSGSEMRLKCPVCGTEYIHNENSPGHREEMARNAEQQKNVEVKVGDKTINVPKGDDYEHTAHYICPKGCKGSGSEAPGNCNVCASKLEHNQNATYHKMQPKQEAQPVQQQPQIIEPSVTPAQTDSSK